MKHVAVFLQNRLQRHHGEHVRYLYLIIRNNNVKVITVIVDQDITLSGAFFKRKGRMYSGRLMRDSSPSPTRRYSTLTTITTFYPCSGF